MQLKTKLEMETPKYYSVEFSTNGKRFNGVVRFFEGDRYWIGVFPDGNSWMVRRELVSPLIIEHGTETSEEVFEHLWNKIKLSIDEK